MRNGMIKYQYAKDSDQKLIDINYLNEMNRHEFKFFCIGCGNELIARLGKQKIKHFAHKMIVTCSGETYLHQLGKQLFYENYNYCLANAQPFYIEIYQSKICNHYEDDLGFICNLERKINKFDLIKYFDKISIETKEGSFIADILLYSTYNNNKIFIEIAVTHLSSEDKINSNYRIIELEISSEEELEPIKRKLLSKKNESIKFINFKPIVFKCKGNCEKSFNFITLDKNEQCLLKQYNLTQIKQILIEDKDKILDYKILKDRQILYPEIFKKGVADFALKGLKIKNCYLCRYHANNDSWDDKELGSNLVFCKFLKIQCNSNQAVKCSYFKFEDKYVKEILEESKEYEMEIEQYFTDENGEKYEIL
jgi:hypothetical protein